METHLKGVMAMIPDELKNATPMKGKERLGAARESEYIGVEDIEPGTRPVLTIAALYNAKITLQRGKEQHDVITFVEETVPGSIKQVRPLVVNATNRKMLRRLYGAVTAETLVGKKIRLFIDPNVRNPSTGEKDGGIRIKDEKNPSAGAVASAPEVIKCADCKKPITAIGEYSAEQVAAMNKSRYGKCICGECSRKLKEKAEAEKAETEKAEEPADNSLADALNAEI